MSALKRQGWEVKIIQLGVLKQQFFREGDFFLCAVGLHP